MKFLMALWVFLMMTTSAFATEETKDQEYYDKQVTQSLQAMTSDLQAATEEMIKYMNAMNKALNESMPQVRENIAKIIASMRPLAETMQKSINDFDQEIEKQLDTPNTETLKAPEEVVIPEPETLDISTAIDEELVQFETKVPQKKIKLFPSSVE